MVYIGSLDNKVYAFTPVTLYTVTFDTVPANTGTITFDSVSYSDSDTVSKEAQTYSITANPATSYSFTRWETEDGVSVDDSNSATTTCNVSADGILRMVQTAVDTDGDDMPDWWEDANGLDKDDPDDATSDNDSDELTNLEEYQHGTDPNNADTDGGGVDDGDEVARGTDPLDPTDDFQPDLVVEKSEEWVSFGEKTYNITYTVKNQGGQAAGASTTSIKIDGTEVATDPVGILAPDESHTNTIGPFTMSGDSDTIRVCADIHTAVAESNEENNCLENEWGTLITGVTTEVNCEPLGSVSVQLFDAEGVTPIGDPAISDGSGNYTLAVSISETGTYTVVASKDGFKDGSQSISITELGQEYELNFRGETGLIPNAPDVFYVLQCVNHWLFPEPPCDLTVFRVLEVVNAWLFPT